VGKGKTVASLVGAALVVAAASVAVGFASRVEPQEFNWEVMSIFGTALGTTLLALGTSWLAASTYQDVRATQRLTELTATQVEASQEANRLMQREQDERLAPAVIGAVIGGAGDVAHVELTNVGGGPAVGVALSARYFSASNPLKDDADLSSVASVTIPYIGPGTTEDPDLHLTIAHNQVTIDFDRVRVTGEYLDRHGRLAGRIIDLRHESLRSE